MSLNPDLVTRIRSIPETMLELVDGSKVIVRETVSEVHDRMADYRAYVMQLALRGDYPEHPANAILNIAKE
jgi:flagellar protein FlbD